MIDMSDSEYARILGVLSALRRKGVIGPKAREQKRGIALGEVVVIKDRSDRAQCLLVFFFGLRKSEASQLNSFIKIKFEKESIFLDMSEAKLKSGLVRFSRAKCLCKHSDPAI